MAKVTPEGEVLKSVREWLRIHRIFHWRNATQGQIRWAGGEGFLTPTETKGIPDIVGILPGGRILMIECKAPKWKEPKEPAFSVKYPLGYPPSYSHYLAQKSWIDSCNQLGGIAFFCTDLSDLEKNLSLYKQKKTPTTA